jgi:hypothetical protein
MFCISKTRADGGKLVSFLELAGQMYPETGLTFEAPKLALASVIFVMSVRPPVYPSAWNIPGQMPITYHNNVTNLIHFHFHNNFIVS